MSDLTAKVTKDSKGSIVVEGYEALKYNFHFDTPVFDTKHGKLAEIYERWKRVLIVIDTSESSLFGPLVLREGRGSWDSGPRSYSTTQPLYHVHHLFHTRNFIVSISSTATVPPLCPLLPLYPLAHMPRCPDFLQAQR